MVSFATIQCISCLTAYSIMNRNLSTNGYDITYKGVIYHFGSVPLNESLVQENQFDGKSEANHYLFNDQETDAR